MKQHWIIIFQGFSFAFLLGLIIGMLVFITPSDLFNWWKGIDWNGQGVSALESASVFPKISSSHL
ncbi:hypothetical protein, partial [Aeromonas veronii]|uniref:hypothetical protein n=1 Tax=Aeromonas veronii TaxID=654 RepID=UPI002B4A8954